MTEEPGGLQKKKSITTNKKNIVYSEVLDAIVF